MIKEISITAFTVRNAVLLKEIQLQKRKKIYHSYREIVLINAGYMKVLLSMYVSLFIMPYSVTFNHQFNP